MKTKERQSFPADCEPMRRSDHENDVFPFCRMAHWCQSLSCQTNSPRGPYCNAYAWLGASHPAGGIARHGRGFGELDIAGHPESAIITGLLPRNSDTDVSHDLLSADPQREGDLAFSRFRGNEVKIVPRERESGYDETEVQPCVQDRGRKARDRPQCCRGSPRVILMWPRACCGGGCGN